MNDTPQGLAAAHQRVLDATFQRNQLAARLIEHDNIPSRHLAETCGVAHQTVRNWAARAKETP